MLIRIQRIICLLRSKYYPKEIEKKKSLKKVCFCGECHGPLISLLLNVVLMFPPTNSFPMWLWIF